MTFIDKMILLASIAANFKIEDEWKTKSSNYGTAPATKESPLLGNGVTIDSNGFAC